MKTVRDLVADLLKAADTTEGKYIRLRKEDAVRPAELPARVQLVGRIPEECIRTRAIR